ncbi:hypothetical protein ATCC90586_001938 [Pythium insidiosum]|nr:hypothetical protein ATCC90586_001938 [Pythium insidiosum]
MSSSMDDAAERSATRNRRAQRSNLTGLSSPHTAHDDLLLLREVVRTKPFLRTNRENVAAAWDAVAASLDTMGLLREKGRSGMALKERYDYLVTMRRKERERDVTQCHMSAAHREREGLVDICIALAENQERVMTEAETGTEAESETTATAATEADKLPRRHRLHYTVRDHIHILREVLSRPPFLADRGEVQKTWDAIAETVRANSDFSKPTATGRQIMTATDKLVAVRRLQLQRNESLMGMGEDYCEREMLVDRWIHLIDAFTRAQAGRRSKLGLMSTAAYEEKAAANGKAANDQRIDRDDDESTDDSAPQNDTLPKPSAVRQRPSETETESPRKKQRRDDGGDESVEMVRLRLEEEDRRREYELRVSEQRFAREQWEKELEIRQAELNLARQQRAVERNAQVQVAKAVAEGIATGIAAIVAMLKDHKSVEMFTAHDGIRRNQQGHD